MATTDSPPAVTEVMQPWAQALQWLMGAPAADPTTQAVTFSVGCLPLDMDALRQLSRETGHPVVHVLFGSRMSIPPRDVVVAWPEGGAVETLVGCRPFAGDAGGQFVLLFGATSLRIGPSGIPSWIPIPWAWVSHAPLAAGSARG